MIDYQTLKSWPIPDGRQTISPRDAMIYALAFGCGSDPMDETELPYVYERALRMFPTMPIVIAMPPFWMADPKVGIDWRRILHGGQALRTLKPMRADQSFTSRSWVEEVYDKGVGKDAILVVNRELIEEATGDAVACATSTLILRGAGGFGGAPGGARDRTTDPDRKPDHSIDITSLPQAALIYRLSGDYNPLHAEPAAAQAVGFPRPILHGLCTLGIAARALLRARGMASEAWFDRFSVRFTAPVFPGETVRTEIWEEEGAYTFRCRSIERDVIVLADGSASMLGSGSTPRVAGQAAS